MARKFKWSDLSYSQSYFLDRCDELESMVGTPWVFANGMCLIEYLAKMDNGGTAGKFKVIEFIRNNMADYASFTYPRSHFRKLPHGVTDLIQDDLPEQMYYILRCGLLHRFSLVPTQTEIKNGGRKRSIVMIHQKLAEAAHLSRYSDPVRRISAAYFVAEPFIQDIRDTITDLFSLPTNHANIKKCLKDNPPIFF